MMRVIPTELKVLRIDAPEWFADEAFREAVERGTSAGAERPIASFHRHGGRFDEYSDIFVLFDAREEIEADGTVRWVVEASDLLDEPALEHLYDSVAHITRQLEMRSGMLWITNVGLSAV